MLLERRHEAINALRLSCLEYIMNFTIPNAKTFAYIGDWPNKIQASQ